MKKCNKCDREFNDDVVFCSSCGSMLEEGENAYKEEPAVQNVTVVSDNAKDDKKESNEPVTIGEWMVLLVNMIPCIGPVIYFVLMLVWALGENVKPSKKSFARANLIFYLAGLLIGVVIIMLAVATGLGFALVEVKI